MRNQNSYLVISSAIVWGAVFIGCSLVLKGTPYWEKINLIILGGIIFHLLIIWGSIGNKSKRKNPENK